MHRSRVVAFVSAGMPAPKKRDHPLARRQLYLNYGALSLATMLKATGIETVLVHGEHREPDDVVGELITRIVSSGTTIYRVQTVRKTLEQAFLELTEPVLATQPPLASQEMNR